MEFTLPNFFGVMSILIGFICVLIAGFLLAVPSARKTPNQFLAVFLLLTALELSVWLWGQPDALYSTGGVIWSAFGRLQMPAFFFFFIASCYSDFRLKGSDSYHLIPFALTLVFNLPNVQAPLVQVPVFGSLFAIDTPTALAMSQMIYFAYMIAIVSVLWRFRKRFQMHHSGGRSAVLVWLVQLAAASLFARVIIVARELLSLTSANTTVLILQMLGALLALGISTWIALKSLLEPHLFRDVDRRLLSLGASTPNTSSADLKTLLQHVETEKPFLDPDLSLAALSDQVAMTPREVSELLNQSLGQHFFDFINSHRVTHAQGLLSAAPKQSVLQILHESGFNSKSSFNTAFKKHSGMTPSIFREKSRNS